MFSLFRVNDPYRFIFLAIAFIMVRVAFLTQGIPMMDFQHYYLLLGERLGEGFRQYRDIHDYTAPLSGFVYKVLNIAFGKSVIATQLVASVFLIFNAAIFNSLLNKSRAYKELTYLPAFFYLAFSLSIPDGFFLSSELMASTFLLLSLRQIVRKLEDVMNDESFTNSGLYIGISSLFYFPAIAFSLLFLVGLMVFSTVSIRRFFLFWYGVFLPLLIAFVYYHWTGSAKYYMESYWYFSFSSDQILGMGIKQILRFSTPIVLFILLGTLYFFTKGRYTNNQVNIGLLFLGVGICSALLIIFYVSATTMTLVLLLPVVGYFMTHNILLIRRKWMHVLMANLILIVVILLPYYWHKQTLYRQHQLIESPLPVLGTRVMVFSDNISYYNGSTIAGPLLQPALSKKYLTQLDSYESAIDIYHLLQSSDPYIIVDEWDIMPKLKERFPDWVAKYRKGSGTLYYKITNS